MTAAPRLTAVVVAHDGGPMLYDCVIALLESDYPRLDVVVVDNASRDASTEVVGELELRRGGIALLASPHNLGFAGGVNAGLAYAASRPGLQAEIYALVNQDCLVAPQWAEPMVETLGACPRVGMVGGRLWEADGETLQHGGGVIHANGLTDHLGRGSKGSDHDSPLDVDYVCGALCALRRETWERFGPLDEGYYPAYFEEVDLCVRLRRAGLSIRYLPASHGVHAGASVCGTGSALYARCYHRSRMRFVARHLLKRGRVGRALRAEAAWLSKQRSWADVAPALSAYLALPGELAQARRRSLRSGHHAAADPAEARGGR